MEPVMSASSGSSLSRGGAAVANGGGGHEFQMPVHYPRYNRGDYEAMPEWKLDCLLQQYGLPTLGDVHQKRNFAMGAFLWSHHQLHD